MMALSTTELSAGYRGRTVLRDVTLDLGPGIHVLLGPNGAGKTTLFRVLAAILAPTSGRVGVAGRDPHRDTEAKRLIGIAGHRAALSPRLTVADNLRYWSRVLGQPRDRRRERVAHVLSLFDLDDLADRTAGTLSRGQVQRVALAKVMLDDPLVLLLDEPTTGMDPEATAGLRDHLRALAADGRTILASTHDMHEAQLLADDVTLLADGRVVGQGTPQQLRTRVMTADGRGLRLRLRARADLTGPLSRLGYRPVPDRDGAVLVDVADDTETETLVERLTAEGVGLREVAPANNTLEEVFLHLKSSLGNGLWDDVPGDVQSGKAP